MITEAYRIKNKKIYLNFGGSNQLEQTKCEAFELLLALQRYVMGPAKNRLEDVKEEIADRIITSQQMIENSDGSIRKEFDKHCRLFQNTLEGHGLHHLFINIIETYRGDIREIIKSKIDRTTKRIEIGYYDK